MDSEKIESTGQRWLSWAYDGVDPSIAGNGGSECLAFVPNTQKLLETVVFTIVAAIQISYAWPRLRFDDVAPATAGTDTIGRRILLMAMCLIFGAEIGFKLASRQMIWILNQCHVITMIQIYLLVAPPSKTVTAIFRIHMHCLNGATIAILFPILNTRTMPFEIETYYIQHAMMLVIPAYLLRQRGAYTPEPIGDYSWVYMTLGILLIYHWVPLQFLAWWVCLQRCRPCLVQRLSDLGSSKCIRLMETYDDTSHVNLNNVMCPAVSDPFHSRWYRIAAAGHQTLLILLHGKAYVYLCSLLSSNPSQVSPDNAHTPSIMQPELDARSDVRVEHSNGYSKTHTSNSKQHAMAFGDPLLVSMNMNGFVKLD